MILFSRDELVHGFILVYSTKRKASLANLSALSVDIPELPLQILAVTEPNGQLANIGGGVYMNTGGSPSDSLSTLLISEGSNLADRLNAHFMTSSASLQQKSKFRYLSSCLIHRNCTLFNSSLAWIQICKLILIFQAPFTHLSSKRSLKRNPRLNKLWKMLPD